MSVPIKSGDRVLVLNAFGEWHEATADSGVEGVYVPDALREPGRSSVQHDFAVIWVVFDCSDKRWPWPAEDVKPSPEALDLRHAGHGRILNPDEEGREVRGYAEEE